MQVFRIFPYPWYFSTDTITKDMVTNTSVPLNCITEFILFYLLGSRKSNPFPYRPKEMFEEGYPKRLFCNSILVPGLPVKQRLRALENAQNPKQVLDINEQQAMTWFQMFSLFSEPTNFPVVLNIGSGVGVCTFFFFCMLCLLVFSISFNGLIVLNYKGETHCSIFWAQIFFWCNHQFRCLRCCTCSFCRDPC